MNLISRTDLSPEFISFLIQVISRNKFCSAEELSTRSIYESESMNLISKAFFWKRDRENVSDPWTQIHEFRSSLKIFSGEIAWIRNEVKSGDMCFLRSDS